MKHPPFARSGVVAVFAIASIALLPSAAMAKKSHAHSASKVSEAQQDFNIRRATRTNNHQRTQIASITNSLADTIAKLTSVDETFKATVPVVTKALQDLQAGLVAVGNGLTTVGAGLTTLGSAYQAVEFGRAAITVTGGGAAAGDKATSADIPDDGNVNTTGDDVILRAATTTVSVDLRALIRSAESDNTASSTVGEAGGFVQVSNLDTGAGVDCLGAPGTTPGGIFGTQPGASIVTPTGTVTNLPLKNIPGGDTRTSTTEPTGTNGTSLLPAPCSFTATAGTDYKVHWSVNFVDIPTSPTPGPTE
ncbi:MAG: hypothetical protein QOG63_3071 [Thermoleophilaceae bacterium]|nr:hypothetical protein [Thermoleophilaceae bacterium]